MGPSGGSVKLQIFYDIAKQLVDDFLNIPNLYISSILLFH